LSSTLALETSLHPVLELTLLILIGLANAAPVLGKRFISERLRVPLDGGLNFFDREPLLGPSKTLLGVLLSLAVTTLASPTLGISWPFGLLIAAAAMIGDLFSSFVKRRLKRPASSKARGLDQIPESLFPLLAYGWFRVLSASDMLIVLFLFFVGEFVISKLLYRLHIRDEPY
jgi:hypothetical protein